ncbi:hypothetical protein AJR17_015410, partial [Shigella boydii]
KAIIVDFVSLSAGFNQQPEKNPFPAFKRLTSELTSLCFLKFPLPFMHPPPDSGSQPKKTPALP